MKTGRILFILLCACVARASTSNGIITLTSPANGSSVPTPITVTASAVPPATCSAGIAGIGIYPTPYNLLFKTSASSFSQSFVLNPGKYTNFVVQEWDKCGGNSKLSISITITGSLPQPQPVVTWGYGNSRNNVNTKEYKLTPTNVNPSTFGKKSSYTLDGYIYGQPLFLPSVSPIVGGIHNVIYVATENNSVYAFDADGGGLLWKKPLGLSPAACSDWNACGVAPAVGVTATPVIDTTLKTIFVEAKGRTSDGTYVHRLYALSIYDGSNRAGSPVNITAKVTGTGYDNVGEVITFNPKRAFCRAALLETGGVIYMGFATTDDADPWHGWILGYNASTLSQVVVYNDSKNGSRAGIWMGGAGLAADSNGLVYTATGNGSWDGSSNWADSYLKLQVSGGTLQTVDYFTPFNSYSLNTNDWDLGSAFPTLLPTLSGTYSHVMIGAGKEGRIYVINRDNLGKHSTNGTDGQILQSIPLAVGGSSTPRNFSTPPYWNGNIFFAANGDRMKQFKLNTSTAKLATTPFATGPELYGFPGGQPVVSANGVGSGIVWAVEHAGVLRAYDATNVARELYNSNQNSTRDSLGAPTKFAPVLVINGRAYVGTHAGLVVYGLL